MELKNIFDLCECRFLILFGDNCIVEPSSESQKQNQISTEFKFDSVFEILNLVQLYNIFDLCLVISKVFKCTYILNLYTLIAC